ncbi:MAG TPA: class F sortase [Acidimicrobiia bacterium]|nr:class F sortase [Acidimicrobiia bacterium]
MRRLVPVLALIVAACGGPTSGEVSESQAASPTTTSLPATTTTTIADGPTSLADRTRPLGSAIFDPAALPAPAPPPVAITIEGVPIETAPVIPVGVEANGEMEIPGAREVGWYRFGPTPAEGGSSVLAAHIAWNGSSGVFRRLADVEIGAVVTIAYADGSSSRHRVTEIAQYAKDHLPLERVFARSGEPVLTLITCGGSFNRSLNSYDDNVVVYATPLD